jgi:hypothetical protein
MGSVAGLAGVDWGCAVQISVSRVSALHNEAA